MNEIIFIFVYPQMMRQHMTLVLPVFTLLAYFVEFLPPSVFNSDPVSFAMLIQSMIVGIGNVISVNIRHYSLLGMTLPNDVTAFLFHINHLNLLAKQDLRILRICFRLFLILFIVNLLLSSTVLPLSKKNQTKS